MKKCSNCGRENEDQQEACEICGSPLDSAPALAPPILQPGILETAPAPQRLNARVATAILFAYIGAQLLTGMIAGIVGFALMGPPPSVQSRETGDAWMQNVAAMAALPILVVSGVAMYSVSRARIGPDLKDTSPAGAAWVAGPPRHIAQGILLGALLACGYFAMVLTNPPAEQVDAAGPIARMAMTPGITQLMWVVIAVLLAPVIEELLFRGVLYGGYRKSCGPAAAALLSTFIFWILHLTEMIHYWPSMIAIASLGFLALWFRLRSAAVGPAVGVHFGYNTAVALVTVYSSAI